uniref:DUF2780 domain-containing protein n=1 Tax=Ningiella ruwaisensis TaxID=2364274 RepID=UPI00109F1D4F|nr:DUF2780 domain-containing protein [Ningiella ruwaisensis]
MKYLVVLCLSLLSMEAFAQQSMLDNLMGNKAKAESQETQTDAVGPSITGLLGSLTGSLDITGDQAQGGLASIMNYAKDNLSADDFSKVAEQLPGTKSLLDHVPDVSNASGSGGLGGLLGQASQLSDTFGGAALLTQQFESLGLNPDMVMGFVQQISSYLDTPQGQQTKDLLMQGLSGLTG